MVLPRVGRFIRLRMHQLILCMVIFPEILQPRLTLQMVVQLPTMEKLVKLFQKMDSIIIASVQNVWRMVGRCITVKQVC